MTDVTDVTGMTGRTGTDDANPPATDRGTDPGSDHAPSVGDAALWGFEREAPVRQSELPVGLQVELAAAGLLADTPDGPGTISRRNRRGGRGALGRVGAATRAGSADGEWQRAPADAPHSDESRSGDGGPLRGARSDAGQIQLTVRDVAALLLIGEMYGLQTDHLEQVLGASAAAVRQVTMRWRKAGLVETGRLGAGPGWCWLTKRGIGWCGLGYTARRPTLSRLAHIRASVAVRLALEAWPVYGQAGGAWRSERRLRALHGAGPGGGAGTGGVGRHGHVPDGEVLWQGNTDRPELVGLADGHLAGQVWAVEVELTPKAGNRTAGVMAQLLGRTVDYGEPTNSGGGSGGGGRRYARVLYVVSPAARATVEAARASLPEQAAARIEIQPLPPGAVLNTGPNAGTNGESGI